jgi:hypothetical protein
MKNLKFLFFVAVATITAVFIYSCAKENSANLQGVKDNVANARLDSIPQPFGCAYFSGPSCVIKNKSFKVLGVPGYPGCSFGIDVEYCEFSSSQVVIKKVALTGYSCQMYADSLAYFANTASTLDDVDFQNRTNALFLDKLENYFFGYLGGYVQCGLDGQYTVSSVDAQCKSLCYFKIIQDKVPQDTIIIIGGGGGGDGKGGFNGDPEIESRGIKPLPVSTACSTDGCCVRSTVMCYDPVTGEVEKTTTYLKLENSPNCNGAAPTPVYDPKYLELIKCTPCQFSCPKE